MKIILTLWNLKVVTQTPHMMMVQPSGSMANNGMKKKSIPPAKKFLVLQYVKKNQINQNQHNKRE
jgi:hypothetical protein